MRTAGMQESRRSYAGWITGRRANRSAVHAIVNAIVLRVIEKVEVLPAKIESARFAEREALEKAEIEVDTAGVGQGVAAHVSEGQSRRNCESCGVIEQRSADAGYIGFYRCVGVTNEIWVRSCPDPVRH